MIDPTPSVTTHSPLIGVVGPCASGKTTLKIRLEKTGIPTRHIAQEHSYVKDMWLRLVHPDILIFLDASYPVTKLRRQLDWTLEEYLEQHRRLAHARGHTNFYILTDPYTSDEVFELVLRFLAVRGCLRSSKTES